MTRDRLEKLERRVPGPQYFRLWDFRTAPPHRVLKCYKWEPPALQVEISEAEFLAATKDTITNRQIEEMAGQS